jgi:hypothetical protein
VPAGSARVTRGEAEAQLALDAEIAADYIKKDMCVSIENNDPDSDVPFHILKVTSEEPYILQEAQYSPILQHHDGSCLPIAAGERVFNAVFYQQVGKCGLKYELWDQQWHSKGRFVKSFQQWEGCPNVIVPCSLVRHFGFRLEKSRTKRKSGALYLLSDAEYDNIESSLNAV